MISLRQLLIIAVVIAGVWIFKRVQQRMLSGDEHPLRRRRKQAGGNANANENEYQETVRCSQCGMFLLPADAANDKTLGHHCHDTKGCAQRVRANTDAA